MMGATYKKRKRLRALEARIGRLRQALVTIKLFGGDGKTPHQIASGALAVDTIDCVGGVGQWKGFEFIETEPYKSNPFGLRGCSCGFLAPYGDWRDHQDSDGAYDRSYDRANTYPRNQFTAGMSEDGVG